MGVGSPETTSGRKLLFPITARHCERNFGKKSEEEKLEEAFECGNLILYQRDKPKETYSCVSVAPSGVTLIKTPL